MENTIKETINNNPEITLKEFVGSLKEQESYKDLRDRTFNIKIPTKEEESLKELNKLYEELDLK